MAQGISWLEAERQCGAMEDGRLVSIMDEEEMQVVHHLIITLLGTKEAKTYIGMEIILYLFALNVGNISSYTFMVG